MIITIDGHAGSGKTSAARDLAGALGYRCLNTGLMYRAAAHAFIAAGLDLDALRPGDAGVAALLGTFQFTLEGDTLSFNGGDLTGIHEDEALGRGASRVGLLPELRPVLQVEQRRLAAGGDIVCEGRDQGTKVFPEAPVKFFFTASPRCRAYRRARQQGFGWAEDSPEVAALAEQIQARDRQDEGRPLDPLAPPAGSFTVDTTEQPPADVLAFMRGVVARCRPPA